VCHARGVGKRRLIAHASLAVAASVFFLACGSATANYDYAKEFDPRSHEYVIGAADELKINVWQNNDLSTDALVRPDGTITMPLVGDIQVAGKTPSEVKSEISGKLAQYIKDSAAVTVAITHVESYRYTVAGEVQTPGTFQSNYYVTVAEAIAKAGGPTRFASTSSIELIRVSHDGKTHKIPISYDEIQDRKHPEENLTLIAGDTVFVP
jgi:polysaccharide export outer membrane protein